jgi:transposase
MLFHYQIRGYFLYSGYVDMRKGIDSLIGLVNNELKQDPLTGDLFIFINRRKRTLKMLHWQGDGFAVFYKRLEQGTYEFPSTEPSSLSFSLSAEQVLFILQGVKLESVRKRKRYSHDFVSN